MVYSIVNINGNVTPAEITFGSITTGTGNISVFTGNNTVIGNSTSFTTQLGNLYVLRTKANVYIGKISQVANNTYATLTTNANVALSNLGFNYQTTTITAITYDEHAGTGNISTFSGNNKVIGNNTTFLTQLNIGYHIFDSTDGNLVGQIRSIRSNTEAELTTISAYPEVEMPFRYYNPRTKNSSNVFNDYSNNIHNALINWGRSGLIQGIKQIKSYHPPIPDPVTGVLVNFPATVHESHSIANIVAHNYDEHHVDNISNFHWTGKNGLVRQFDDDRHFIHESLNKAIQSIPMNRVINKIIDSYKDNNLHFGNSVASLYSIIYGSTISSFNKDALIFSTAPSGFEPVKTFTNNNSPYIPYQNAGNVVYVINSNVNVFEIDSPADMIARATNRCPPPRITDIFEDAKSYYASKQPEKLTDAQKADLAARAADKFAADRPKVMRASGVPAVIPGQLNVILHDDDPAKREYINPRYSKRLAVETTVTYNKDLPASTLNPKPNVD